MARHSQPLERGATAKGASQSTSDAFKREAKTASLVPEQKPLRLTKKKTTKIKSLPMGAGGTKPVVDPLAEAKRELAARTGQVYNKGGIQYLTDEDLAEQRKGTHKRR